MITITVNRPKGCFMALDHERITAKDIKRDRPSDQTNISCERAICHGAIVRMRFNLFNWLKPYWVVLSTTTYEMAGDYRTRFMGGRSWAETDMTGLEWHFDKLKDAEKFAYQTA